LEFQNNVGGGDALSCFGLWDRGGKRKLLNLNEKQMLAMLSIN